MIIINISDSRFLWYKLKPLLLPGWDETVSPTPSPTSMSQSKRTHNIPVLDKLKASSCLKQAILQYPMDAYLTLVLLNPDIPCLLQTVQIQISWLLKNFVWFGLNVTFNNLSVISRQCLDVTGSSMLTFRVLSHWNIMPQTLWYDIPPSHIILTLSWPVPIPSSTFSMLSAKRKSS